MPTRLDEVTTAAAKWDGRYAESAERPQAAACLIDHAHLLPDSGIALDLACGLGGSALFMARAGLETHAWDISTVGLERLRGEAGRQGLSIQTLRRDVEAEPPAPNSFDVIVVSHFLHRPSASRLAQALKPRGLLFYQTWTREKPAGVGPGNPDFLLEPGELLRLFSDLRPLVFRDEGTAGDRSRGVRGHSWLVAQQDGAKP